MPLLTVAQFTLREAVRRRLLLAVAVLTLVIMGLTGWLFMQFRTPWQDRYGQPINHAMQVGTEALVVIMISFMFSMALAVGAAVRAAPAIAGEVENGVVLAMLPRPMRRADLVLGKWLGLSTLLAAYVLIIGGLEFALIDLITGYLPPQPLEALLCLAGQSIVVLSLALLGSTRLPPIVSGVVAIVLVGIAWIAGIITVIPLDNKAVTTASTVVSLLLPTDGLWRGALHGLTPAVITAVGNLGPFAVTGPPTTPFLLWAVGWVAVVMALAVRSFGGRDL